MDLRAVVVDAIHQDARLPTRLRANTSQITDVDQRTFDASYIEFLETQIALGARGLEWTEQLKRRRKALLPYCDALLISALVTTDRGRFTLDVDPASRVVVHYEEY